MGVLSAAYPTDLEAKLFYALALLAADPPEDTALANPKKVVAILNPLLFDHPDHPGIAHYILHALAAGSVLSRSVRRGEERLGPVTGSVAERCTAASG